MARKSESIATIEPNPLALQNAWQHHPKFKKRALGGRRALDGFHYQLKVSLDRFFAAVLANEYKSANIAFEGLSDLSEHRQGLEYLIQIKTTLRKDSLLDALQEALAVDEFLEECCPAVRESYRFKITTRSLRGNVATEPSRLTASDLGLESEAAQRWEDLRKRCEAVELDSAPEVSLAIRLWNDVTHPTTMIDACVGRLMEMLPSRAQPGEITKSLLKLWDSARRSEAAPLFLLGAADFEGRNSAYGETRIVHGVRPSVVDVRDGCFMDRPERLGAALSVIHERWAVDPLKRRGVIPIFWITGPSGAGKSVLLLQIVKELLESGQVEIANFLESYAHALPRALESASGAVLPILVAGDDLYSADNRDPAIWGEIGELTSSRIFSSRFSILTCGPLEQFKAFSREVERHRAIELIEIVAEPLNATEQCDYHSWYQRRTGFDVPLRRESIFVAAAWIYELYRAESLTPEAFVARFDRRLGELDIKEEGHAALALNLYGLKAPESLFVKRRAPIAQLLSEQIWRLASPGSGTLSGRFFHPQIARLIYDAIVSPDQLAARAENIAFGFKAMLDEGEPADAFLSWLGSKKTGKNRTRGALTLDGDMRIEILKALWPVFRERGATYSDIPRLLRWHNAAIDAGLNLNVSGVKFCVRSWWSEANVNDPRWGLLFQMVWDLATNGERDWLRQEGKNFLDRHLEAASWPWIFRRLLTHECKDSDLRNAGIQWLKSNGKHQSWPAVWGGIFETLERFEIDEMRGLALAAIPTQPESEADLAIWERTATLEPLLGSFLDAITRKLSKVQSPYKMKKGVEFMFRYIGKCEFVTSLSPALIDTMDAQAWTFLWSELSTKLPNELALKALGHDWLKGRENQSEWSHVWQKLIDQNFERATLLPIGRDWLKGRENQPEWSHVWQKLVDQDFECATLLPIGRDWLKGRENEPEWNYVWQKLIDQNFERATLLPVGRDWLKGRENQPEWNYVWRKLIDQNFECATLLPVGGDWLKGRENQPDWNFVWQKLIDQNFERATLLPIGRDWLRGRESQPEWSYVWRKLVDQNFECATLFPIGRDWLKGRENQPEWSYVWQKLVDQDFECATLLPIGRDWLKGRENEPEWSYVWQKLVDRDFERATLLPIGRDWLKGRKNQPGWYAVNRRL